MAEKERFELSMKFNAPYALSWFSNMLKCLAHLPTQETRRDQFSGGKTSCRTTFIIPSFLTLDLPHASFSQ